MSVALAANGGLEESAAGLAALRGLDRVLWNEAEPGLWTGVLPPGVDEPRLLADLVESLRAAIAAGDCPAPLLLALHEGLVRLSGGEFRGPALTTVRELGRARLPGPFSVVVSRRVFEDLEALEFQPFPVSRFRPVTIGAVPALVAGWPL